MLYFTFGKAGFKRSYFAVKAFRGNSSPKATDSHTRGPFLPQGDSTQQAPACGNHLRTQLSSPSRFSGRRWEGGKILRRNRQL